MPTRYPLSALIAAALVLAVPAARAGDAKAAETKASTVCAACHGPKGHSSNPLWPHLAGQQEAYLVKQMKDFRDGKRSDPVMAPMAQGLSDAEIEDLAAYYAAQKPAG